jgi:1-phosphofructokinase family hexose kinase
MSKIITVGLSPAWDVTCCGANIDWGKHSIVQSFTKSPAGKSLNVSKALGWMGIENISAGLWGDRDYQSAKEMLGKDDPLVKAQHTLAEGRTRENITVIDTLNCKEMHLRSPNKLLNKKTVSRLCDDLKAIVKKGDICVFSGSIAVDLIKEVSELFEVCRTSGAGIALDTSGKALKQLVSCGNLDIIKPNAEELSELSGEKVNYDNVAEICRENDLLGKVDNILVSFGELGGALINNGKGFYCKLQNHRDVVSTVACGDYFLAGYLWSVKQGFTQQKALEYAVKAGTAKAWGLAGKHEWGEAISLVKVETVQDF